MNHDLLSETTNTANSTDAIATPPAPPAQPSSAKTSGNPMWAQLALTFALIAILTALPVLWWKAIAAPTTGAQVAEAIAGVTGHFSKVPDWYPMVRASSILTGFIALILIALSLIFHSNRKQTVVAAVLCIAAFAVSAPWLTLMAVGILVLVPVAMMLIGAM